MPSGGRVYLLSQPNPVRSEAQGVTVSVSLVFGKVGLLTRGISCTLNEIGHIEREKGKEVKVTYLFEGPEVMFTRERCIRVAAISIMI
jgi:hypothetical protein